MKTFTIILSFITAALSAAAGISSDLGGDSIFVMGVLETRRVAVSIAMPADFVAVPIRVFSDQKNTALAYDELHQAIDLISQKAKESGRFRTTLKIVTLSQQKGGYGFSSGSWNEPGASTEIYLLVPLTKESDNIFDAGAASARFLDGLHLPGKARFELGRLQLAVENPEQYRAKLLGVIAEEIKKTRETIAPQSSVKVEGLESPVLVQQAGDRNVKLFLNYSLAITTEK